MTLTIEEVFFRVFWLRDKLGSQKKLAAQLGISETYLSDMINGRRALDTKLLRAVGVERVVRFEAQKGWKP